MEQGPIAVVLRSSHAVVSTLSGPSDLTLWLWASLSTHSTKSAILNIVNSRLSPQPSLNLNLTLGP